MVAWDEFHEIENAVLKENPQDVIIFSDCVLPVNLEHPEWYTYLFRDYEEIEIAETIQYNGSINYYLNKYGAYYTVFNSRYIGTKSDIDRLLGEFEDPDQVYIVFWRNYVNRTDSDVQIFFQHIDFEQNTPIRLSEFKEKWEIFFKEYRQDEL